MIGFSCNDNDYSILLNHSYQQCKNDQKDKLISYNVGEAYAAKATDQTNQAQIKAFASQLPQSASYSIKNRINFISVTYSIILKFFSVIEFN